MKHALCVYARVSIYVYLRYHDVVLVQLSKERFGICLEDAWITTMGNRDVWRCGDTALTPLVSLMKVHRKTAWHARVCMRLVSGCEERCVKRDGNGGFRGMGFW